MIAKFNLSIEVFTRDVHSADVAHALRGVADRLAKFTSSGWGPYGLQGEICARNSKRVIGTWSLDPEAEQGLQLTITITAENDSDSRVHCKSCGEHVRDAQKLCVECRAKEEARG